MGPALQKIMARTNVRIVLEVDQRCSARKDEEVGGRIMGKLNMGFAPTSRHSILLSALLLLSLSCDSGIGLEPQSITCFKVHAL